MYVVHMSVLRSMGMQVSQYIVTYYSYITWCVLLPTVLVPGPVENLMPSIDPSQPSVMLSWKPPANSQHDGDVKFYEIRFNPSERVDEVSNGASNSSAIPYEMHQITFDSSITTIALTRETAISITRELGLIPLTKTTFQVRAENADSKGEWTSVSTYVGMYSVHTFIIIFCHNIQTLHKA